MTTEELLLSIALYLERIAQAEEHRNDLVAADQVERREAWAEQREKEEARWAAVWMTREAEKREADDALPLGEPDMHAHDDIGLHRAETHHRLLDYRKG
jgi:hypothetical protein